MLMELFMRVLERETDKLHENNIRLTIIGDRSRLSNRLQERCDAAESLTGQNTGMQLNIAASYGGRWDIAMAARRLASAVAAGERTVDSIDEEALGSEVCLHELPEPDLFVRTGGEQRISNFLLWQLAYTELYFTPVLWPDFDAEQMTLALEWFATRHRRFGQVGTEDAGNGAG